MAYTVLARRYRSTTFDEVIGQAHIAQTLKRAIESDRIAHAFLFCGTRGTGKTSMARILAKALNCQATDLPNPAPCNKCNSCLSIARGDDMSVIEIDAASNTGVDDVRSVIENAYTRAPGRYKIYIIDEVHMLSKQAFNALLKTLEEPPSHVKFILATTEPEKVLPTILSRCQRYDFRNIPTREIAGHLKNVCKSETIKADEDALLLVAKAGAGSMRDALSLLDRLLSIGEKHLTVDTIESMLGMPKSQVIFDLAGAIGSGNVKAVLETASGLINGGLSTDALCAALTDHLRNLLVLRACGAASDIVDVPGLSIDDLVAQANTFDIAALSQDIALLEELRRSLRTSQAGRALIDATLVRLALADQFLNVDAAIAGDATGGSALKKKSEVTNPPPLSVRGERSGEGSSFSESVAEEKTPLPASPPVRREEEEDADDSLPMPGRVWEDSGPSLKELLAQEKQKSVATATAPVSAPSSSNIEPVDAADFSAVMARLRSAVHERTTTIDGFLMHGSFDGVSDGIATLRVEPTAAQMLERNGKKQIITEELSKLLGHVVGLRFSTDESAIAPSSQPIIPRPNVPAKSAPSPANYSAPPAPPSIRITNELREELKQRDPRIRFLMEELKAEIVRVEPADT